MTANEANAAVAKDHDPFDAFRAELKAFRLVPLIYSHGRDGLAGIDDFADYVFWIKGSSFGSGVNSKSPYLYPQLTPYEIGGSVNPGLTAYFGTAAGEGAADNVHNHMLGLR
jgi:hypothetical protein